MATCARCRSELAPHLIRSDHLCRDCFVQWVRIKVSKHMSDFRVGLKPIQKVLLAISFGCCSLSLLALLDKHLQNMEAKANRVGYELSVLHVLGADAHEESDSASQKFRQLESMFPRFTFVSASLEEGLPTESSRALQDRGSGNSPLSIASLSKLSASSHEDMMLVLRKRLILKKAQELSCTSVLLGESTTKISERILAETAKGRGFALPQLIGNVQAEDGIRIIYPLRELYRVELAEYVRDIVPELWTLSSSSIERSQQQTNGYKVTSARNMTIDKLLGQYMKDLEETTPSIVSNVLRTSQKLSQPKRNLTCQICGLAMDIGTSGLRGWGGDQDIDLEESVTGADGDSGFCYGCTRSLYGNA